MELTERHRTKTFYDLKQAKTDLRRYVKHQPQIVATYGTEVYAKNVAYYEARITELTAAWSEIEPGS